MHFNTGQVRDLTGVRREQLRHWRKVLPPLVGRDGRADQYTFSEVFGISVVACLVEGLGISVSRIAACADDIFALFTDNEDFGALPRLLHVTAEGRLIVEEQPPAETFATVRITEVFDRLKERLAPEQRRQLSLPL